MAKGEGVSLDTFLRVLIALGLQENLDLLLPDPSISPIERVRSASQVRRRARPSTKTKPAATWSWADDDRADD